MARNAQEVDKLLAGRCTGELLFYDGITHAGMLNMPKYLRNAIQAETRIITEENPVFVY